MYVIIQNSVSILWSCGQTGFNHLVLTFSFYYLQSAPVSPLCCGFTSVTSACVLHHGAGRSPCVPICLMLLSQQRKDPSVVRRQPRVLRGSEVFVTRPMSRSDTETLTPQSHRSPHTQTHTSVCSLLSFCVSFFTAAANLLEPSLLRG